jgi:hypothetical protein
MYYRLVRNIVDVIHLPYIKLHICIYLFIVSIIEIILMTYIVMTTNLLPTKIDVNQFNYTDEEYLLWNSYTTGKVAYIPTQNNFSKEMDPYIQELKKNVKVQFSQGYNAYCGVINGKYDMKKVLTERGSIDESTLLTYVSFSINEAYNMVRRIF